MCTIAYSVPFLMDKNTYFFRVFPFTDAGIGVSSLVESAVPTIPLFIRAEMGHNGSNVTGGILLWILFELME